MSFSSLQTAALEKNPSPPALRIRSKVSNISRSASENPSPSSLHPSPRLGPTQVRVRSPSTSSNVSQMANTVRENPSPQFYPITTATSAANPHSVGRQDKKRESSATEVPKPVPDFNNEDSPEEPLSSGRDSDHSELKVKAAAKSNRKIADLEITNRSLLSINATLEATKNRQMKEIRELRRKLRESRLILPPGAYRAYKSSVGPEEEEEEEDEEEDSEVENAAEGDGDETYKRVKLMIENLISSGKKALETKVEDFQEGGKGGAKVLTAEEVQSWHRSNNDSYSELESDADISQTDISVASSVNGDDDEEEGPESGGIISFLSQLNFPRSSGPPIRISEA
ncbi:hypothetical protein H1R20_g15660, partial [Candolleomyces eurysporus]